MAQQQKNKTKKKLALNIVNGVYGCHIENLGSRKGGGGGGGGRGGGGAGRGGGGGGWFGEEEQLHPGLLFSGFVRGSSNG